MMLYIVVFKRVHSLKKHEMRCELHNTRL